VSGRRLATEAPLDQGEAFAQVTGRSQDGEGVTAQGLGDLDGDGLGEAVVEGVLLAGAPIMSGADVADGLDLGGPGIACDLDGDGIPEWAGSRVLRGEALARGVIEVWADGIPQAQASAGDLDGDGREEYVHADPALFPL
jgi:hypothetical protein